MKQFGNAISSFVSEKTEHYVWS